MVMKNTDISKKEKNGMDKDIAYKIEIEFKPGLSDEEYANLKRIAQAAYNNRCGTMLDISDEANKCIFEGGEVTFNCILLAQRELTSNKEFLIRLEKWDWEDYLEPEESGSVFEVAKRRYQ